MDTIRLMEFALNVISLAQSAVVDHQASAELANSELIFLDKHALNYALIKLLLTKRQSHALLKPLVQLVLMLTKLIKLTTTTCVEIVQLGAFNVNHF